MVNFRVLGYITTGVGGFLFAAAVDNFNVLMFAMAIALVCIGGLLVYKS